MHVLCPTLRNRLFDKLFFTGDSNAEEVNMQRATWNVFYFEQIKKCPEGGRTNPSAESRHIVERDWLFLLLENVDNLFGCFHLVGFLPDGDVFLQ